MRQRGYRCDWGGKTVICYHGSDTVVDQPKILTPKRPLDFGGGFYVTTDEGRQKNGRSRSPTATTRGSGV